MLRASSRIASDAEFEKYNAAMEMWNNKADAGNVMAYVSSWGEANPGGHGNKVPGKQGQFHAGLPLGHTIAHCRNAGGNLGHSTRLFSPLFDAIGIIAIGLMGR